MNSFANGQAKMKYNSALASPAAQAVAVISMGSGLLNEDDYREDVLILPPVETM